MDLKKINEIAKITEKPSIKMQDLPQGIPIPIIQLRAVNGKFGEAILAELESAVIFFPRRVTNFLKENLENFQPNKYSLLYKGQKQIGTLLPTSDFEIIETA